MRVTYLRQLQQGRNLACSAAAEGLALAHIKINEVISQGKNSDKNNHSEIVTHLQGQLWQLSPQASKEEQTEALKIVSLTACIPKDTPITDAHIANVEIVATVEAETSLQTKKKKKLTIEIRERRAFRINDSHMATFICRRPHQLHINVEGGDK